MRHGVDSQETLGKLGLPGSGDLLAEGKLAKTFWEVMSMHDRCTCKGTWFDRPGGRGRQKLANHMGNFLGNSDPQAQSATKGTQFD